VPPTILQRFVVLEGLDGSGTTTQMKLLAERLEREARPHAVTWEPTDGPVGSLIRSILTKKIPAHPRTVALLFAADRNEHLYEPGTGIAERTKRGEIVICDRYLFSSLAYQSLESDPEYVLSLNSAFPLPQLLVFLDTPVDVCQERLARRGSAELYDGFAFQSRVRAEYVKAIERFRGTGMRIECIAGDRPAGLIHGEIWTILAGMPIQKV
jgi:dTMP kinase